MSVESVMPSNHLILCHPLLLQLSIFSSIKIFSNESIFCIRWPNYWSFSFSISPCSDSGLISFRMDWLDLLAVQEVFSSVFSWCCVSQGLFWGIEPPCPSSPEDSGAWAIPGACLEPQLCFSWCSPLPGHRSLCLFWGLVCCEGVVRRGTPSCTRALPVNLLLPKGLPWSLTCPKFVCDWSRDFR